MCLSGYFLIFLSLLLTASLLGQSANEECSLFVGVMFPPTAPNKSLSKGFTGVRRAIEIINNSSLLSGYKLHSMHLDTEVRKYKDVHLHNVGIMYVVELV